MTETSSSVTYEVQDGIGLIALDNPPVNAAAFHLRQGIDAAIKALDADPAARVIALYGKNRAFIAGADIREFGKPVIEPNLPEVCDTVEASETPVIAILHGPTLGGGLEVAISAHARIARPDLLTGLPEVTLGVLPGAGGTQRGPRLMGIAATLDLATTGRRIGAEEALSLGLIDRIAEGAPRDLALAMGQEVLDGTLSTQRTADRTVGADDAALAAARDRLAKTAAHLFSPHRIVDAIALSTGPLRDGLAAERAMFFECIESPQRAGLIHAFFAERAVSKILEANATPRDLRTLGIVGGGTMGSGIATAALLAGVPVTLSETSAEAAEAARTTITRNLDGAVKRGKMSEARRDAALRQLSTAPTLDAHAEADVVIEAVFEDMDLKKRIFKELDAQVKPGAILATNTSYLDVGEIASATSRPQDVVGLHFFSPAHIMRLLEVVVADSTAPDVVATGFALAKRLRKVAVRAGVCDGFIGNRILSHYRKVTDYMLLDGAGLRQIDAAIRGFGFAMGPFEVSDQSGLDIGWATRKRRASDRAPEERYVEAADRLCEAGHFGKKTGAGFYLHDGSGAENPALLEALEQERAAKSITLRIFTDDEIVDRYMTAMVSEATRVLEEGIALRPVDIDAVFLFGYGFPRHRGGPMFWADTVGAQALVRRIEAYAEEDGFYWQVPDLLRRMAQDGTTFAERN